MVRFVALALCGLLRIAAVSAGPLDHGDTVLLTVPRSSHRVTAQSDGQVHAKWDHQGGWQQFVLERADGAGAVRSGDMVLFRAWTGKRLTVQDTTVHAKWDHSGAWQKFVIELKGGVTGDPVTAGSKVFLKAHTGKRVDADAPDSPGVVQARWSHQGGWQELMIESPHRTPRCAELTASHIPDALSVTKVQLPAPLSDTCGGFGVRPSCRHGFYAATPHAEHHALLYNDAVGMAHLVLFDGEDRIVETKELGTEEVRGLQFDPSARHLVALMSGGTGVQNAPSYFVKMSMPTLDILWRKPIESPMVGMEKWTPDNSDSIAISEDRYVLHSAGVCKEGEWCAGHQGDLFQVLDATTGEQLDAEGKDWRASHSCKQMVSYNPISDTFLVANAGDAYPKALQYTAFARGNHLRTKTRFATWGNGGGRQGVTQGAIKAEPMGPGFASVFSLGNETVEGAPTQPDRLYFAALFENTSFVAKPRPVFPDSSTTQLGGNLAPLGEGRWLIAYTEAEGDVLTDYLRIYWDNWSISEDIRMRGSRLAILDAEGTVLGEPVDASALGASFPLEINHLMERPSGVGWASIDGPGASTATLAHIRCDRA